MRRERCAELLALALERASGHLNNSFIEDWQIADRVDYICSCPSNRAGVRLLLAATLAKLDRPQIDIRKPYTEIGDADSYSGRTYDEQCVTEFINRHQLPCNSTTAFLTPAFRNINQTLVPGMAMVGRPRRMYDDLLQLLDDIHNGRVTAQEIMDETIRCLLVLKQQQDARMRTLLDELHQGECALALSSEDMVNLIQQHLSCRNSSRLPVLIVAAAYQAASEYLRERILELESHNAADEQTGALGDIEVTLIDDERVVTSYEMKTKRVAVEDIDRAVQKIANSETRVDNYIFITTEPIDEAVAEYAKTLYQDTGGIEFVILDCIGFLRHFLHLFHRIRADFLDAYQRLVLAEPTSAVSQPLKEAFLALRRTAEIGYANGL